MRRREFISLAGSAAVTWPLSAHAQAPALPVVGFLGSMSLVTSVDQLSGFRQGLNEMGFAEGRDVSVEYRWSDGQYAQLPAMAAEFISRRVAVILAGGLPAAAAALAATKTIPIVFVMGADPVAMGIVPSLNRPGGNVTGASQFYGALGGKRLELLRESLPQTTTIAVLSDPNNPNAESHLNDVQAAARAVGQKIEVATARTRAEIEAAFANIVSKKAGALLVADDPFFTTQHELIVTLAAQNSLPAIYYARQFAVAGGLLSYGSSSTENFRQGGAYVGRILKGDKPSDLPVLQPTKFELIINLKTAKSLGLVIPQSLVLLADEVIE